MYPRQPRAGSDFPANRQKFNAGAKFSSILPKRLVILQLWCFGIFPKNKSIYRSQKTS